jgi:hypothetical protein
VTGGARSKRLEERRVVGKDGNDAGLRRERDALLEVLGERPALGGGEDRTLESSTARLLDGVGVEVDDGD